jgi:hypothetical protein
VRHVSTTVPAAVEALLVEGRMSYSVTIDWLYRPETSLSAGICQYGDRESEALHDVQGQEANHVVNV